MAGCAPNSHHRDTENTEKKRQRILGLLSLCSLCLCGYFFRIDPAAWGGDHVGKPLPDFVTGDECLFCHRADIGPTWADNRHNRAMREIEPASAARAALGVLGNEATVVLGNKNRQRFLKPGKDYGKLDILSVAWSPKEGKLLDADLPQWSASKFGDSCAGCHVTATDATKRSFAALSLDCYVCHGDVPLKHSKDTTLAHLNKKQPDSARVVTSICAQCHVRSGKSKASGLPYPNNFVAGDNLFRDFQVDFADAHLKSLNPADRHILDNVRNVVVLGKEDVTCLTCHEVHKQSAKKHHRVAQGDSCLRCHEKDGPKKVRIPYEVHSATCEY